MNSISRFSGDADYPAWKHPRVDSQMVDQTSDINPLPAQIENFLGGGVYGERLGNDYTDEGQDNAQVSPATVTLKYDREIVGHKVLPQHTLVCWENNTNVIHNIGTVYFENEDTDKVSRFATVVSEPEICGKRTLVGLTMHPWDNNKTMQVGILQTDVKVGDNVTVGIQHFSHLFVEGVDFLDNDVCVGRVIGLGCEGDGNGPSDRDLDELREEKKIKGNFDEYLKDLIEEIGNTVDTNELDEKKEQILQFLKNYIDRANAKLHNVNASEIDESAALTQILQAFQAQAEQLIQPPFNAGSSTAPSTLAGDSGPEVEITEI